MLLFISPRKTLKHIVRNKQTRQEPSSFGEAREGKRSTSLPGKKRGGDGGYDGDVATLTRSTAASSLYQGERGAEDGVRGVDGGGGGGGRGRGRGRGKCEGDGDVVGVVTPLVRGGAQVLHGDQVVELSVLLEVHEREEKGEDGEGQIEVEDERGELKERRTCTWMT